jgi:beta-galactosidase
VPFEPGTLKAVGKNDGKPVAEFELRTAGEPAKIILKTESKTLAPGFDNVAFASAEVVDENGILIPHANDLITFNISGPGKIAAVDSANNASHESFQATERRAFQGRCFAILKATGATEKIILTASAPGLKSSSITIPTTRAGE